MAENAYSCKTNFIILPLPSSPRPVLFISLFATLSYAHNESPRLLAYFRLALYPQISFTNPFRSKTYAEKLAFRFYTRFPLQFPSLLSSLIRERFEIFPYSPFLSSSTIYIFIRDKFHSNLIQRDSVLSPFSLEITRYIFTRQFHST